MLSSFARYNDVAARINENSFVFAFQCADIAEAQKQTEAIIKNLNEYTDRDEKYSKSIFRMAVYRLGVSDRNCELLLLNLRRYCNKVNANKNQIVFCDAHSMNDVHEEKEVVENIIEGMKNNEFKLYLQFIVDSKTREIVSAEALSRWENAEKGIISPAKYIETMESAGLISKLDFYMFELVCKQLEKWNGTEFGKISLSCNFTRITLSESDFISVMREIADKYSFERSKLTIEITENAMEQNHELAMKNVSECKKMGFTIALDDLGSGYTSLSNLCDYPIDVVKIDRDILLKTEKKNGKELFEGMIALAHSLNLKVVCEGVETEAQNVYVRGSECDYIQGWYYSKAFPVKESETIITEYSANLK